MSYQSSKTFYTEEGFNNLVIHSYNGKYKDATLSSDILGITRKENSTFDSVIMKCICSQKYSMTYTAFVRNCKQGKDLDCGCIKAKTKELKIQKAIEFYKFKQIESEMAPYYCKYCESYRESISKWGMSEYCDNCRFLLNNQVRLGKSFDELMNDWNPNTKDERYKILPIMKGNWNKGFEVVGSTLIDSEFYEELSKVLWIYDIKNYAQTSMSKENLKRMGTMHICYTENIPQVRLHRVILGIHNLPSKDVVGDHINGDKRDNRLCNLRVSTNLENSINSKKHRGCQYKYIGIYNDKTKTNLQWRARVFILGKGKSKYFSSEIKAAMGYDNLLREYRPSPFNVYNFPRIGERGKDGSIREE